MSLINDFLSLIYPRRCEACLQLLYAHEAFVCSYCRVTLPPGVAPGDDDLMRLFAGRVPMQRATTLYRFGKGGRVQRLLHAIKYHKQAELAYQLGNWYAEAAPQLLADVDVLLPVPLHPKKMRVRGFNQSERFAAGLAVSRQIPVGSQAVQRLKHSATQTRKRKYERWENVDGIFGIAHPEALKGKHILIVDDVITTGATIEALWLALQSVEDVRVSVIAIAFADH